jgi:hypothetical protein
MSTFPGCRSLLQGRTAISEDRAGMMGIDWTNGQSGDKRLVNCSAFCLSMSRKVRGSKPGAGFLLLRA